MERARWLDELAHAIGEAQSLAWHLGVLDGDSELARDLYARLETVRSEVASLRFGDWVSVRKEIDPIWLETVLRGRDPVSSSCGD